MPNASTNRIRHDALGVAEITVRCACANRGTLIVLSTGYYVSLGASAAKRLAESRCPRCSTKGLGHAKIL
ncbi:MAG TPA: hypothetical protein VHX17_09495 [Candidatus Cybelea sp.]|jgi:hypothetical protein|nr:hypothetical protein [Candidatus Cybelea sp.]